MEHPSVFFENNCSEYFREIPGKTWATEPLFSMVMNFKYPPCCKWFSWNFPKIFRTAFSANIAGGIPLILSGYSLKPRIPFYNTIEHLVVTKGYSYLKANLQLRLLGLFKYACPFITTSIKGSKNTTRWVLHQLFLHIHWKKSIEIAVR